MTSSNYNMISESFIAATLSANKANTQLPSNLKDVGICVHEVQPQSTFRHGYKKTSVNRNCLAISESHVFAAQAEKAVINVYSRERGNQEATVPFPERIHSLCYIPTAAILVIGTAGGKLMLWETATGRLVTSSASHLQAVSSLCITDNSSLILSTSSDSAVHVWSLHNLVTFAQPSTLYSQSISKAPVRTFSAHRQPVTAIACGHSRTQTAFAVSCSADQICYIWSIHDCQILRTYLLPSMPLCCTVDIADRAVFIGYEDGSVQLIDFYRELASIGGGSLYSDNVSAAVQLTEKTRWPASITASDSINCMTLSFDGTFLFSGHTSGKIISWDVAKGRMRNQVIDFSQPVTNIHMLRPTGLLVETPRYKINNIVKPRLDLGTQTNEGGLSIPPGYTFHAQIMPSDGNRRSKQQENFRMLLSCQFFPEDVIDEGLYQLGEDNSVSAGISQASDEEVKALAQLQKEVADLNSHLDILRDAIGKSRERRMKRIEKREKFFKQKREALQQASKGKKGDALRSEWERKEQALDQESDDEEVGQPIYGDLR